MGVDAPQPICSAGGYESVLGERLRQQHDELHGDLLSESRVLCRDAAMRGRLAARALLLAAALTLSGGIRVSFSLSSMAIALAFFSFFFFFCSS